MNLRDIEHSKFEAALHDKKFDAPKAAQPEPEADESEVSPERAAAIAAHLAARQAEKLQEVRRG